MPCWGSSIERTKEAALSHPPSFVPRSHVGISYPGPDTAQIRCCFVWYHQTASRMKKSLIQNLKSMMSLSFFLGRCFQLQASAPSRSLGKPPPSYSRFYLSSHWIPLPAASDQVSGYVHPSCWCCSSPSSAAAEHGTNGGVHAPGPGSGKKLRISSNFILIRRSCKQKKKKVPVVWRWLPASWWPSSSTLCHTDSCISPLALCGVLLWDEWSVEVKLTVNYDGGLINKETALILYIHSVFCKLKATGEHHMLYDHVKDVDDCLMISILIDNLEIMTEEAIENMRPSRKIARMQIRMG